MALRIRKKRDTIIFVQGSCLAVLIIRARFNKMILYTVQDLHREAVPVPTLINARYIVTDFFKLLCFDFLYFCFLRIIYSIVKIWVCFIPLPLLHYQYNISCPNSQYFNILFQIIFSMQDESIYFMHSLGV